MGASESGGVLPSSHHDGSEDPPVRLASVEQGPDPVVLKVAEDRSRSGCAVREPQLERRRLPSRRVSSWEPKQRRCDAELRDPKADAPWWTASLRSVVKRQLSGSSGQLTPLTIPERCDPEPGAALGVGRSVVSIVLLDSARGSSTRTQRRSRPWQDRPFARRLALTREIQESPPLGTSDFAKERSGRWIVSVVTVLGFALPLVAYFWLIHEYGVNSIWQDQWDDVNVIAHPSLGNLWALHNDNRIFFPNLIVLCPRSRLTLQHSR